MYNADLGILCEERTSVVRFVIVVSGKIWNRSRLNNNDC